MKLTYLALATASLFSAVDVFAAPPPDIGNALRQSQPPPIPAQPVPALPPIGGAPVFEAPLNTLPQGLAVEVKKFEIVGNQVIQTPTLLALVADNQGKSLSLGELNKLAERITLYYRDHGYFVARAYIPQQEIVDGAVKIRVVEGNYGKFHLKNNSLVRNSIVQGMLDDVKGYNIVSNDTLERAMLIINDTPGVKVTRADVMPGEQVGTSDFAIETVATPRFDGYLSLDNYGSTYTGENRLNFNVNINSPLGIGDRLSVSGMSSNNRDLLDGRVDYSVPLAANGLRGDVALSETTYLLGDSYGSLDATGKSKGVDIGLTYPIRKTQAQTIEASITTSYKDLYDNDASNATYTPRSTLSVTAGLSVRDQRTLFGLDGETDASIALTSGVLRFGDQTAYNADAAGAQTNGGYQKLLLNLSRVSLLPYRFTLNTSLSLQRSLNNQSLDGSERMSVSGWTGVWAYPSGEMIADNALLLRAQLSHPFLTLGAVQSDWSWFSDYGQGSDVYSTTVPSRRLSDMGFTLSAHYKNATLTATYAHRLGGGAPQSEPYPRNKFLMQGVLTF